MQAYTPELPGIEPPPGWTTTGLYNALIALASLADAGLLAGLSLADALAIVKEDELTRPLVDTQGNAGAAVPLLSAAALALLFVPEAQFDGILAWVDGTLLPEAVRSVSGAQTLVAAQVTLPALTGMLVQSVAQGVPNVEAFLLDALRHGNVVATAALARAVPRSAGSVTMLRRDRAALVGQDALLAAIAQGRSQPYVSALLALPGIDAAADEYAALNVAATASAPNVVSLAVMQVIAAASGFAAPMGPGDAPQRGVALADILGRAIGTSDDGAVNVTRLLEAVHASYGAFAVAYNDQAALFWAVRDKKRAVVRVLLDYLPGPADPLANDMAPLREAAANGDARTAYVMLDYLTLTMQTPAGDMNVRDFALVFVETALDFVESPEGFFAVYDLLKAFGSNIRTAVQTSPSAQLEVRAINLLARLISMQPVENAAFIAERRGSEVPYLDFQDAILKHFGIPLVKAYAKTLIVVAALSYNYDAFVQLTNVTYTDVGDALNGPFYRRLVISTMIIGETNSITKADRYARDEAVEGDARVSEVYGREPSASRDGDTLLHAMVAGLNSKLILGSEDAATLGADEPGQALLILGTRSIRGLFFGWGKQVPQTVSELLAFCLATANERAMLALVDFGGERDGMLLEAVRAAGPTGKWSMVVHMLQARQTPAAAIKTAARFRSRAGAANLPPWTAQEVHAAALLARPALAASFREAGPFAYPVWYEAMHPRNVTLLFEAFDVQFRDNGPDERPTYEPTA